MKKIITLFAFLTAALIYSCDKVDAPYREEVVVSDFCKTGIEDSIPRRKVLVEEFTGHLCGNCPPAAIYLNDSLKKTYGHCMVVISIHAGWFAHVCPQAPCPGSQPPGAFTTDFRNPVGEACSTFFGVTSNPIGMINRTGFSGSTHLKSVSAWAPAIAAELAKPADAHISITNNYNSLTHALNVSVETEILNNVSGDFMLQVMLTEDSITDWQEWYNHTPEFVPDYTHHHVLRDAINTTWGEQIVNSSATAGTTIVRNYSYNLNAAWNDDYCSVVAFVYKNATKEVIQVEEKKIR